MQCVPASAPEETEGSASAIAENTACKNPVKIEKSVEFADALVYTDYV